MASKSQRKATRMHRRRVAAHGLMRVEVQAPKKDAGLIRALEIRRGIELKQRRDPQQAESLDR